MKTLPEGYKVFVTHFRRWEGASGVHPRFDGLEMGLEKILPTGGLTTALIVDPEGMAVSSAKAKCSKKDHFSKRIGRNIATGRALKKLEVKT